MRSAFFLLALLIAVSGYGLRNGYAVNVTPSLARGLYRASAASPVRGDIAGFCLDGAAATLARERGYVAPGSCGQVRPLLKYVAGVPGDTVTVTEDGILCGPPPGRAACGLSRPCLRTHRATPCPPHC